ncbi:MAG: Rnase Y domain-containing protein, partial [Candidatus Uhrbacteria bacterium]|nr:Rnase Y domain-containing protein [Candidatus Uhrbacteria bacterium]
MFSALLLAIACLGLGSFAGYRVRASRAKLNVDSAEAKAEQLLAEARTREQKIVDEAKVTEQRLLQAAKTAEQQLLLDAKEKAIGIVEEGKLTLARQEQGLKDSQGRLQEREQLFDKTLLDFENKKTKVEEYKAELDVRAEELVKLRDEEIVKLQTISNMSKDAATTELFRRVEEEEKEALLNRLRKLDQVADEEIEIKARKILALAIQRFASSQVVDATTTFVDLPSDDMKGRIIGKEGRNIKAIEHLTGCELIIDDTPNSITISGFSPVRRQVAKRALEMLLKDGRIQPAKIEEAINEAKKELAKEMKKAGEDALYELGIPVSSIDPKLVSILGRLKFRTSYGQNVLQHSLEVARLSGMIAEELGADVFACKKGGLFHDIGKAVDHDMQGAHPQIGFNIMKKFGFPEDLCYQSFAHHEDRLIAEVFRESKLLHDVVSNLRVSALHVVVDGFADVV